MNNWYNYYSALSCRLLEYIEDERNDSLYYNELAKFAPSPKAKKLLLDFSKDEAKHAEDFSCVYRQITGIEPSLPPLSSPDITSYSKGIERRILAESNDFVKYGEEFLNAPDMYLRNLFYNTETAEAKHGMGLPLLLCYEREEEEED